MTEAIVAGAIAGAVAGAIAGLAVWLVTHGGLPRPSGVRKYTHPVGGGWVASTRTSPRSFKAMGALSFFDDFDESGRRVMATAQTEAIRLNHNYIGTEHLLLGVVRADAEGPAGRALARLGVTFDKVRTALEFIVGKGDAPVGPSDVTVSPRTRMVLELAADEGRRLGHAHVGAAEILLGLVREGEGIASGILESLGVTLDSVRLAVMSELGTGLRSPAPGTPAPPPPPSQMPPPQPPAPGAGTRTHREGRGPGMGPFDRFNDRAKRVLALAQDEAIRFNHNYIGPEHLLLGIVREGEGVGARVLSRLGIDLSKVRQAVESAIGRGESTASPSEITLIPRAKKVIELAIDEARKLGHSHVGTEHLLLGLVRDDTSMACEILKSQGVPLEKIRYGVVATFDEQEPPPAG